MTHSNNFLSPRVRWSVPVVAGVVTVGCVFFLSLDSTIRELFGLLGGTIFSVFAIVISVLLSAGVLRGEAVHLGTVFKNTAACMLLGVTIACLIAVVLSAIMGIDDGSYALRLDTKVQGVSSIQLGVLCILILIGSTLDVTMKVGIYLAVIFAAVNAILVKLYWRSVDQRGRTQLR